VNVPINFCFLFCQRHSLTMGCTRLSEGLKKCIFTHHLCYSGSDRNWTAIWLDLWWRNFPPKYHTICIYTSKTTTLQLGSINHQNVSSCPLCQMCMCLTFLSPKVSLFSLLRDCYCFQYRVFISHLCVPRCVNSRRPVHPWCFLLFNHSSTFLYMSVYSHLFLGKIYFSPPNYQCLDSGIESHDIWG
jgi:hypothetical protein